MTVHAGCCFDAQWDDKKADKQRRGRVVCASTIVRWAAVRPDLWDARPEGLLRRCIDVGGASPAAALLVLIATGRWPLVRHALGDVLPRVIGTFEEDAHVPGHRLLRDRALGESEWTRGVFCERVADVATATGSVPLLEAALDALSPLFRVDKRCTLAYALRADRSDIVEYLVRHGVEFGGSDRGDKGVWYRVGKYGAVRVFARFMALCRSGESSGVDHSDDGAFAVRLQTSWHRHKEACVRGAAASGSLRILGMMRCDGIIHPGALYALAHVGCLFGRVGTVRWALDSAAGAGIPLDVHRIASMAVACPLVPPVDETNSRSDPVAVLRWLCDSANIPYRWAPTPVCLDALMSRAMAPGGSLDCALWIMGVWPVRAHTWLTDTTTSGSPAAQPVCGMDRGAHTAYTLGQIHGDMSAHRVATVARLVCLRATRHGPQEGPDPSTIEDLVRALDAWALRVGLYPEANAGINLWRYLCEAARGLTGTWDYGRVVLAIKGAWARCHRLAWDDLPNRPWRSAPVEAPHASWLRWCRVCPLTRAHVWDDRLAEERFIRGRCTPTGLLRWLARHSVSTPPSVVAVPPTLGSTPTTVVATAPEQRADTSHDGAIHDRARGAESPDSFSPTDEK